MAHLPNPFRNEPAYWNRVEKSADLPFILDATDVVLHCYDLPLRHQTIPPIPEKRSHTKKAKKPEAVNETSANFHQLKIDTLSSSSAVPKEKSRRKTTASSESNVKKLRDSSLAQLEMNHEIKKSSEKSSNRRKRFTEAVEPGAHQIDAGMKDVSSENGLVVLGVQKESNVLKSPLKTDGNFVVKKESPDSPLRRLKGVPRLSATLPEPPVIFEKKKVVELIDLASDDDESEIQKKSPKKETENRDIDINKALRSMPQPSRRSPAFLPPLPTIQDRLNSHLRGMLPFLPSEVPFSTDFSDNSSSPPGSSSQPSDSLATPFTIPNAQKPIQQGMRNSLLTGFTVNSAYLSRRKPSNPADAKVKQVEKPGCVCPVWSLIDDEDSRERSTSGYQIVETTTKTELPTESIESSEDRHEPTTSPSILTPIQDAPQQQKRKRGRPRKVVDYRPPKSDFESSQEEEIATPVVVQKTSVSRENGSTDDELGELFEVDTAIEVEVDKKTSDENEMTSHLPDRPSSTVPVEEQFPEILEWQRRRQRTIARKSVVKTAQIAEKATTDVLDPGEEELLEIDPDFIPFKAPVDTFDVTRLSHAELEKLRAKFDHGYDFVEEEIRFEFSFDADVPFP